MDPNETLKTLRKAAKAVIEGNVSPGDAVAVAEAFQDLDTWIMHGGFLPSEWAISLQGRVTL